MKTKKKIKRFDCPDCSIGKITPLEKVTGTMVAVSKDAALCLRCVSFFENKAQAKKPGGG